MTTQTRIIRVQVDTKGDTKLKQISRDMGKLNRNVKSAAGSINLFRGAFQTFIASLGIRELARASDEFQLLRDRLRVFAQTGAEAAQVFQDIATASRLTRSSINDTGSIFNRFKIATDGLGLSNEQILATTIALQQSFRLAGSSAQEAASATLQLSQAFSLGRLQGQELRAILLSNGVLSRILREEFAGTGQSLKELGEQGRLTIDRVLKAILENFTGLNDQASKLGTTFTQSLIIAFDQLRLKVDQLNQRFGLSSAFAQGVLFIAENFDVLNGILTALAFTAIPKVIASFAGLLTGISPVALALAGIGAAVGFLATDWELNTLRIERAFLQLAVKFPEQADIIVGSIDFIKKSYKDLKDFAEDAFTAIGNFFSDENLEQQLKGFTVIEKESEKVGVAKKRLDELNASIAKLEKAASRNTTGDLLKQLREAISGGANIKNPNQDTLTILRDLNAEFRKGNITIQEYNERLRQNEIAQINQKFEEGVISIEEYNDGLTKTSQGLTDIEGIAAGVQQGLITVAQNAGNVAAQISQGIQNTFRGLEDVIVSFVQTGEFEFKKFTQAVLEDLTRIIVRASIIAPIANALTAGIGAGGSTAAGSGAAGTASAGGNFATPAFAKGAAFRNGNVIPFATGGIVTNPTYFPMSGGRTGLMGEAGAEAILPLTRGPGGKLGVQSSGSGVTVNVINNSNGEVTQQESTDAFGNRTIDIFIQSKVQEGIANGSFDKTLQQAFGLNRRAI